MSAGSPNPVDATHTAANWLESMSAGDWISSIATAVTAAGVVWAIWQHVQTQRFSAKLAVLEHRRAIYDRLREVLLELNTNGDTFQTMWVHAHQLWIDSEFLYDSDVRDYLRRIADRIAELEALWSEWRSIHDKGSQAVRQENVRMRDEVTKWLQLQHLERIEKFDRYLRLP